MKLLLPVLVLLASAAVSAQDPGAPAAARERISDSRRLIEADFAVQEKACYQRFAVNDCLLAARNHRREALAALRREEIALNDAERQRKAAERLQSLQERAAERDPAQEPGRAAPAAARQQQREPAAAQKPAAAAPAATPAPATAPAPAAAPSTSAAAAGGRAGATARPTPPAVNRGVGNAPATAAPTTRTTPRDTSEQVQKNQQRLEEAQARKERVARKQAERTKPPAAPLPTPP